MQIVHSIAMELRTELLPMLPSGDEAHLTLMKPVVPDPVEHHYDTIAETDQVVEVQEQPDQPGKVPPEVHAEGGRHGGIPADGCHVSLVMVAKRGEVCAALLRQNRASGVNAHLHGYGSSHGKCRAVLLQIRHVTDDVDFGVTGQGQIRFDGNSAPRLGRDVQSARNWRGL